MDNIPTSRHRILHITSSNFNELGEIYGGYSFSVFYVQEKDGRTRITSPSSVESVELRKTLDLLANYIKSNKELADKKDTDSQTFLTLEVKPEDGNKHTFVTLEDTFFSENGCPEYTAFALINFHESKTGMAKTMYNTNVSIDVLSNIVDEFRRLIVLKEQDEEEKVFTHKADA